MENLPEFINKKDNSWHRTSSGLETAAKIYGIRVDAVHNATQKFICELSKTKQDNQKLVIDENTNKNHKEKVLRS
jgi:hypothetical protein